MKADLTPAPILPSSGTTLTSKYGIIWFKHQKKTLPLLPNYFTFIFTLILKLFLSHHMFECLIFHIIWDSRFFTSQAVSVKLLSLSMYCHIRILQINGKYS